MLALLAFLLCFSFFVAFCVFVAHALFALSGTLLFSPAFFVSVTAPSGNTHEFQILGKIISEGKFLPECW